MGRRGRSTRRSGTSTEAASRGERDAAFDALVRRVAHAPDVELAEWPALRIPVGTVIADVFQIDSVLGIGGMGVVYAARDCRLDRRVAIKVHHSTSTSRTARMWREARAMARLSHPNVLAIHEVGWHGRRVFIAMELVDGGSLTEWLAQPRTNREVIERFAQAADGLAAAHAAGLVHRDFKPDNVLVGTDGRVRVADFGLAREGTSIDDDTASPSPVPALGADVTCTGAAVGTPAYMSPEQLAGMPVDARADQFSFCVALYEALYGERPFAGRSVSELAGAVASGEVRRPPGGHDVPAWVDAVVRRGLYPEPADRWPSMTALAFALRQDPAATLRRRLGMAALVAALVATAAGTWLLSRPMPPCLRAGEEIALDYDADEADAITAAFEATGSPLAAPAASRVRASLDAYTRQLRDARRTLCIAGRVEHTVSAAGLDARLACLDQRRRELQATVSLLVSADRSVVARADDLVSGLGTLSQCESDEAMGERSGDPHDPHLRLRIDVARARLDKAAVARRAGQEDVAARQLAALDADPLTPTHPPLRARMDLLRADLSRVRGDRRPALEALSRAYRTALSAERPRLAAEAALGIASLRGTEPEHYDDAMRWWAAAAAYADRYPSDIEFDLQLDAARAAIAEQGVHYDEAIALATATLDALDSVRSQPIRDALRLKLLTTLATAYTNAGRHEQAVPVAERALLTARAAYGSSHPKTADALLVVSSACGGVGDLERAVQAAREATRIRAAAFGEGAELTAWSRMRVAGALVDAARVSEAAEEYEAVLATAAASPDARAHLRSSALVNLGRALQQLGSYDRAVQVGAEAVDAVRNTWGEDSLQVGQAMLNFAAALAQTGDVDLARRTYAQARPLIVKHLGPTHPQAVVVDLNLASAALLAGQEEESARALERAQTAARLGTPDDHVAFARIHRGWAELAVHRGDDQAAARELEATAEAYRRLGPPPHPELASTLHALSRRYVVLGRKADARAAIDEALEVVQTLGLQSAIGARIEADAAVDRLRRDPDDAQAQALGRAALTRLQALDLDLDTTQLRRRIGDGT